MTLSDIVDTVSGWFQLHGTSPTKVSENVTRQRQCRKCLITLTTKSKLSSWGKGSPRIESRSNCHPGGREAPRIESRGKQDRGRPANACLSGHYRTEEIILRQSMNINEGNQMSSASSVIGGGGRKHCHTVTTGSTHAYPRSRTCCNYLASLSLLACDNVSRPLSCSAAAVL
ncbi:hypothetical protein CEXT_191471 [Caerostris extrusa]|uniref:Uncharacterized protein n=1 Tax=Caerostris extrusa TaxID=172846 RepID=A0AAV4YBP5_CAEEX|nr:hypothetical protein CEXT_191471 [Caerostris extrusa]